MNTSQFQLFGSRWQVFIQDCPLFRFVDLPINFDTFSCPSCRNGSLQHVGDGNVVFRLFHLRSYLVFCKSDHLIQARSPHVCFIHHVHSGKTDFWWVLFSKDFLFAPVPKWIQHRCLCDGQKFNTKIFTKKINKTNSWKLIILLECYISQRLIILNSSHCFLPSIFLSISERNS